jgi:molecular chaperone DnaK
LNPVIGIDLGTTHSVAAVLENGQPRVLKNAEGHFLTPSVVSWDSDGQLRVGSRARWQVGAWPPVDTVSGIKRHMGTDYQIKIRGKSYTPQGISALILKKIKQEAQDCLGKVIKQAVITVPAYFSHAQRQATYQAGQMAGLEVLRMINEPTAAALAYALHQQDIRTALVWDLGGGTFDVSILELGGGVFHVKSVSGNTRLGGDDWDQRLADYLAGLYQNQCGFDLRTRPERFQRLLLLSETIKCRLSEKLESQVFMAALPEDGVDAVDFETRITRQTFEQITRDLTEQLLISTRQALTDARLNPSDIDRIVLVGGATRMPAIRQLAADFFGQLPDTGLHPEQVVAMGAAIQAGMLTGELQEMVLVDVTPLSLGIESEGGLFARLINRNTPIPTSAEQIFTNSQPDQTEMDFKIVQGERELAADNIQLGRFQLTDITPLPRGHAHVEVKFNINASGMLEVSAYDLHTENETGIRIENVYTCDPATLEALMADTLQYAVLDKAEKLRIQARVSAESMIQAANLAMDSAPRLGEFGQRKIDVAIARIEDALSTDEPEAVEREVQALKTLLETLCR